MNKVQFLSALDKELSHIPREERKSALEFYEEYLTESEDEAAAIAGFGSVKEIAAQISADYAVKKRDVEPPISPKKGFRALWVVILTILASPIALPLGIAAIAVLFSLVVAAASVVLSIWVTAAGCFIGGLGVMVLGIFCHAVPGYSYITYYGFCLMATGVGILLLLFSYYLTKVIFRGMARLFRCIVDRKKRNEEAQ